MEVLENAAKTHSPTSGNGKIIPIGPCDVTSKDDLEKLRQQLKEKERSLDLLSILFDLLASCADTSSHQCWHLRVEGLAGVQRCFQDPGDALEQ